MKGEKTQKVNTIDGCTTAAMVLLGLPTLPQPTYVTVTACDSPVGTISFMLPNRAAVERWAQAYDMAEIEKGESADSIWHFTTYAGPFRMDIWCPQTSSEAYVSEF